MSFKITSLLPLIPVVLVIGGCSGLANKLDTDISQSGDKVQDMVKEVGRTAPGAVLPSAPLVTHESGIWLGKNVVKLGQPALPPIFYEPTTFDRTINSLMELAERFTLRSGIPSKVSPDALAVANAAFRTRVNLPGVGGMLPLPAGLPGESGALSAPRQ